MIIQRCLTAQEDQEGRTGRGRKEPEGESRRGRKHRAEAKRAESQLTGEDAERRRKQEGHKERTWSESKKGQRGVKHEGAEARECGEYGGRTKERSKGEAEGKQSRRMKFRETGTEWKAGKGRA